MNTCVSKGRVTAWLVRFPLSVSIVTTSILLGMLVLLHLFAGMGFTHKIQVENASGQAVYVTPVGERESGGKTLLPLRRPSPMAYAVARRGDYEIKPGARIEFMFDMDDVRFTELVISSVGNEPFQIPVEKSADCDVQYCILITHDLPGSDLDPEIQDLLDAGTYAWRTFVIYAVEAGLLVLLIVLIRVRRRFASGSYVT
jgi:hypothetical protein